MTRAAGDLRGPECWPEASVTGGRSQEEEEEEEEEEQEHQQGQQPQESPTDPGEGRLSQRPRRSSPPGGGWPQHRPWMRAGQRRSSGRLAFRTVDAL